MSHFLDALIVIFETLSIVKTLIFALGNVHNRPIPEKFKFFRDKSCNVRSLTRLVPIRRPDGTQKYNLLVDWGNLGGIMDDPAIGASDTFKNS